MVFDKIYKKEKRVFRKRFYPSIVVALSVALITLFFQMNAANILIFSCLGASALILANESNHKTTSLRVVFESYLITGLIAIIILYLFNFFEISFFWQVFATMFFSSLLVYAFDCFHPPAIGSSLAFLIFQRSFYELLLLIAAIFILLTMIRFLMYIRYEELKVEEFFKEFKKKKNDNCNIRISR